MSNRRVTVNCEQLWTIASKASNKGVAADQNREQLWTVASKASNEGVAADHRHHVERGLKAFDDELLLPGNDSACEAPRTPEALEVFLKASMLGARSIRQTQITFRFAE